MPRHPKPSPTTDTLRRPVFEAIHKKIREHHGILHRLNVGDTWLDPPAAARSEAQRCEEHPLLHTYAAPHGERALVDAIHERLNARCPVEIERAAVQVCAGATNGISTICQTILDPGDEVLLLSPYWPLIRGLVASRGAVPVQLPFYTRLDEEGFDPEAALEEAITPRTAAIYINTPNNPTGCVLTEEQMQAVALVAERNDLWILSDEAYEDLWFEAEPPPPFWAREEVRDRVLAIHTFSKAYGLAGARVGWFHGPLETMLLARAVLTHQVYCAPRPMQFAALAALREGSEWLEEARRLYGEAARKAAEALEVPVPPAGTFLFVDVSRHLGPDGEILPFLEGCLDAGVQLTPGDASGVHFERWIRLCFTVVPPDELDDALARLRGVMGSGA